MNKKITSSILAAIIIAGSTFFTTFAAMPSGTVIIGTKAFDLAYANDPANLTEISNAIVDGGAIYVKDFNGNWINNINGLAVATSVIPSVIYKNAAKTINYNAADIDVVATTPIGGGGGVTTPVDVTAPVLSSVSLTIGQSVSATKDASGAYKVSLVGKSDTDMFTAVNLNASEKVTVKINCMGKSRTFTTNDSGEGAISVADLLGSYAPNGDGISVGTLKSYLAFMSGKVTLDVTLKDVSGNETATTITITAN